MKSLMRSRPAGSHAKTSTSGSAVERRCSMSVWRVSICMRSQKRWTSRPTFRRRPGGRRTTEVVKTSVEALELKRLGHEELLEAVATELAAVAGLLVAAERGHRIEGAAVDLHLTRADPRGHALGA